MARALLQQVQHTLGSSMLVATCPGRWYERLRSTPTTMDLENPTEEFLDLRGVACPLNWARAKARLEEMDRGARLVLLADDPRAQRDIPGAAEAEGWAVVGVTNEGDAIRIVIER